MDKHISHIEAVDCDADGNLCMGLSRLTYRYWTGEVRFYSGSSSSIVVDQPQASAQLQCGVTDIRFIGLSRRVIVACDSGAVDLWELAEEKDSFGCVAKSVEHDNIVSSVCVSPSAKKFLSTSYDNSIVIWDIEEFQPVSVLKGHYDIVWSAAFHSTNSDIFASCSQDGHVLVWDLRQPKPATVMEKEFLPSLPTCVSWQPNHEHNLAVGTETGHILVHDSRVGVGMPKVVHIHNRTVHRLAFSPYCVDWLASASEDCTCAVTSFALPNANVLYRNSSHQDYVQGLCWNPATRQLCSCSWDGTVQYTDVATGQQNSSGMNGDDSPIVMNSA